MWAFGCGYAALGAAHEKKETTETAKATKGEHALRTCEHANVYVNEYE
jgi:hypothetical protein